MRQCRSDFHYSESSTEDESPLYKKLAGEIVDCAGNTLKSFDSVIFGEIDKDVIKKAMGGVQEILKEAKRRGYY